MAGETSVTESLSQCVNNRDASGNVTSAAVCTAATLDDSLSLLTISDPDPQPDDTDGTMSEEFPLTAPPRRKSSATPQEIPVEIPAIVPTRMSSEISFTLPSQWKSSVTQQEIPVEIPPANVVSGVNPASCGFNPLLSTAARLTPPRQKSSVTQRELPVETPANVVTRVNLASCGFNPLLSNAVRLTVAANCSRDALSIDTEGDFNRTAISDLDAVSNLTSSGSMPSLRRIPSSEIADKANVGNLSADIDEDSSSGTSPPQLKSYWEDIDVISDRSANKIDDFPANVSDDPPFSGFGSDPRLDDLVDLATADRVGVTDQDCPSGMFGGYLQALPGDGEIAFRCEQLRTALNPPKSRVASLHKDVKANGASTGKCRNPGSSRRKPSNSSVALNDSGDDDDIAFNHFSPQKETGIDFSPRHRIAAEASQPKTYSRRKRLFGSKRGRAPPSTSVRPVSHALPSPELQHQRCCGRKRQLPRKIRVDDA